MLKRIYLDNASTTYVSGEVMNEMIPCFNTLFGNANSLHSFGRDAAAIVDRARDRIATVINANSNELFFTSGGTEGNNWAIWGLAHANQSKGKHIITTKIEHDSIIESCHRLEKEGFEITYLPVDSQGLVSIADLLHYIRKDTILVSIMAVNNEVGTIQNIKTIGKIAHENGAIFHTDAVQALGTIKLDVKDMEIDAMTMSAHKIYGPMGVGALFVKNGVAIEPLIVGGNQERGKRGGTINVPAIAGFGKAAEIAARDMVVNQTKMKGIRDYFIKQITEKIEYVTVNGHMYQKVPNILNLSFEMIDGEALLAMLDLEGIAVSTGSACMAGSTKPSHVLLAMGLDKDLVDGSVRISFGKSNTKEEIDFVIEKFVTCVEKLRAISPITKTGRAK